ncbi:MAG: hypothetical protein ISS19_10885 [Bacteroidales bacterium]|nr:hypothetical protein [Bacteroidales bacterium]
MNDERKKKLIDLGPDVLADALLKLAEYDDTADRLVERLTSDPDDIIRKFKRRISGLKRRKRFIHWRESRQFAAELDDLLEDLEEANPEPCAGMTLVASFFETDQGVYGNCDDSSGYISNVYRYGASRLFAQYAFACRNKKKVLDLLIKTYSNDPYGVREGLLDKAREMLGDKDAKNAIHIFELLAEGESNEFQKRHFQLAIESLARQTGDAKLFEKVRLQSQQEPGTSTCLDIARVYLESGHPNTALEWIERIPSDASYMYNERIDLMQKIYGQLGDSGKQEEMAWLNFRTLRCLNTLDNLLKIIGEEKKEQVIEDEAALIIDEGENDYSDIQFLIDVKRFDEAEICILVKAGTRTLNGDYYYTLLPMAKALESEGRNLAASMIYRALMESILDRKSYKAYPHAARYLRKLDMLAVEIDDWQDLGEHGEYHVWLNQVHGKKTSFWRHYRGE